MISKRRLNVLGIATLAFTSPAFAWAQTAPETTVGSHLWGKFLQPVQWNGTTVPVGTYVKFVYDGGDGWITGDTPPEIYPKNEVQLVSSEIFPNGPTGTINTSTAALTEADDGTSSIVQSAIGTIPIGTHVEVTERVGDFLFVDFNAPDGGLGLNGPYNDAALVPVTSVTFDANANMATETEVLRAPDSFESQSFALTPQGKKQHEQAIITNVALYGGTPILAVALWWLLWRKTRGQYHAEKAERDAAELYRNNILTRAAARWPHDRFPRIYEKDNLKTWETYLDRWPNPPATDAERKENEKSFWKMQTSQFTVGSEGSKMLKPKQEILDKYQDAERWILRQYYAMTGIYIEPFVGPECKRLMDRLDEAKKYADKFWSTSADNAHGMAAKSNAQTELRTAREKVDEYLANGKKRHFEKWAEWYFFHIEDTFRKTTNPDRDFGPQSATSPVDHPAADDLAY